jgi:uncharacterized protein
MSPVDILKEFYQPNSPLYALLVDHSRQVADKALAIASGLDHLSPDLDFIERAAMLHDIGIIKTRAPSLGCTGDSPYVSHGYLGREMLDGLGMDPAYGLVAERHTGAGITKENIVNAGLPLPPRDMVPLTLEEKIICSADKYFSKSPKKKGVVMTRDRIIQELETIDPGHARRFRRWAGEFNL